MTDRVIAGIAFSALAAAALAPPLPLAAVLAAIVLAASLRRPVLFAVAIAAIVGGRAHEQIDALAVPLPERVSGPATLADDPEPQRFGTRVVVEHAGRRYVADVPADLARPLRGAGTGDRVVIVGRPSPLEGAPTGWVRSQHLAGRLSVSGLEPGAAAAPWFAAANSVRRTLAAGAASFDAERRPLYLGMVIGDDRLLSEVRQHRFRAAGLSHLTAVSGQNVAFLLAVAAPLLVRLGPRGRVVLTLLLLVAMVLVTRADPSVLRASVMAGVAVVAVTAGRVAPALRVLSLTITVLLLADPMMFHSLGFRLSVAATAGLVLLTGPLERRLPGPRGLRLPLAVTISAQLATAPFLIGLNGGLSPASIPANLLAVPAAGGVMMLGVTVGAVAGLVAEPIAERLQLPSRALVTWIDVVAGWGSSAPVASLGPARTVLLVVVVGAAVLLLGPGRGARGPSGQRASMQGRGGPDGRQRAVRRQIVVVGVVVAAVVWPTPPAVGRHDPAKGLGVAVGQCGGIVAEVAAGATERSALATLTGLGVRRIDVLVVHDAAGARRVAAALSEQWPVRRRLDLPHPSSPRWNVGGVTVVVDGPDVTIEVPEGPCSLTP